VFFNSRLLVKRNRIAAEDKTPEQEYKENFE
jgi:hypothetical protein